MDAGGGSSKKRTLAGEGSSKGAHSSSPDDKKLRVQEKDQEPGQEEQAESDQENEGSADTYGSLDAGRPKNFSADEDDKGKEAEDDDDEGDDPPPRSPDVDINKSAKVASIFRIVIYQLRVTYGSYHTKILKAIVTPHIQPNQRVMWFLVFSSASCRMQGGALSSYPLCYLCCN